MPRTFQSHKAVSRLSSCCVAHRACIVCSMVTVTGSRRLSMASHRFNSSKTLQRQVEVVLLELSRGSGSLQFSKIVATASRHRFMVPDLMV